MPSRSTLLAVAVALGACGGTTAAPVVPAPPAATPVPPPSDAPPASYVVIIAGRPAGTGVTTVSASGSRTSHFTFNDRGRGPDVTSVLQLDPDGKPVSARVTGHDYFKAPVDEKLELRDGELSWSSSSERGRGPASGFYVPLDGPFDIDAVMAAALLRAPGKPLSLLPAGEARIEDDETLEVELGGTKRSLRRLAISGLSTSPTLVWIDERGAYFAQVSSWLSTIREGAEALIPTLLADDDRWRAARAARIAADLAESPPAAGLAFIHARLFDSEKKRTRDDATVVLAGDRIVAVGGPRTPIPPCARIIDAAGRTLLPGLWDMHVHIGDDDGVLDLACGVTTVRDMGNDIASLAARSERFDAFTEVGPRVLRAGLIDGPGPMAAPTGVLAGSEEEARAAVERFADLGYPQVKIYSSIKPELVPVIARAAHRRDMRVSGHVPAGMIASEAVAAGYDEIQHANMLFLNFLATPGTDTRGPARFVLVATEGAGLDLRSAKVTRFLDLLQRKRVVLDPTLTVFEGLFTAEPDDVRPTFATYLGRLPAQLERGVRGGGLPAKDGQRATFRASNAALGKLVALAWRRGIRIVAGTDDFAGLTLQRELELYVAAGIPAAEVLALATIGAARVMGKDRVSGSIAAGKQADLVLVDGDPLAAIGAIRNVDLTVARGRIYDPRKLFPAIGMKPR